MLIHSLRLTNLLSYGPSSEAIPLGPLNVLIGANGSGKSNIIEAVGLLRAAPRDLAQAVLEGDGIGQWLWKGAGHLPEGEIDVVIANPDGTQPLRHRIALAEVGQRMAVVDESIENEKAYEDRDAPYFYYKYQRGRPVLNVQGGEERGLRREDLSPDQSVLSQRKDPDSYPVVTYLGRSYEQIRIYQEWNLGRRTAPRRPQDTALDRSFLLPDASNLAPVLNEFEDHPRERREIRDRLQQFLPGVEDFYTRTEGGTIQVYLRERGLESGIAATRLSDGTLRYLLLLSVLCHPDPPPLVCIEEPEIGLHPDVLPTVAELLVSAAERTQLIVTTHSDALLCSPILPEHVVVCERDAEGSHLRRLEPEALRSWLRDYTLGDVWRMGEIGGNRW